MKYIKTKTIIFITILFLISLTGVLLITMSKKNNIKKSNQEKQILILETNKGKIEIEMLNTIAPEHVNRIAELVKEKFYNGVIFHRVIPGFMAQTGDPTGTGMSGSGKKIKSEFSDYNYTRGTVGMARTADPNSADSQFFICYDDCSHLNGSYTVWGQVIKGMKVVDNIEPGEPPSKPDSILTAKIKKIKSK